MFLIWMWLAFMGLVFIIGWPIAAIVNEIRASRAEQQAKIRAEEWAKAIRKAQHDGPPYSQLDIDDLFSQFRPGGRKKG